MSHRYLFVFLLFLSLGSQAQMDTSRLQQDAFQLLSLTPGLSPAEVEARWGAPNHCLEEGRYCEYGPGNGLKIWFDEQARLRKISLQALDDADPIVQWIGEKYEQLSTIFDLIFDSPEMIKNHFGKPSKEDVMGGTYICTYHLPELKFSFFFQKKRCVQLSLTWLQLPKLER